MDRNIVYPSSIPQDVDILNINRNAMVALGYLMQMVLGTGTVAAGLAASPGSGLAVSIAPGCLTSFTTIDATPYGSLAANGNPLVKMGILSQPASLSVTAPTTAGQSVNWLIEAQVVEADGGAVVLPFVNAANPTQPYSGPGNSGAASNTIRTQSVALQVVQGAAATTGTQTTPAATAGWVGLWVVTVAFGQTSLYSFDIGMAPTAPFLTATLPQLRPGFSDAFIPVTSSGSWTVPPGVTLIRATLTGGGGAGGNGGGATGATYVGGGGAGGGHVRATFAVSPGQALTFSVGSGGTGSGAGGTTTLTGLASATGGSAGSAGSSTTVGIGATSGGTGAATGPIGSALLLSGNGGQAGYSAGSTSIGGAGGGGEGRALGSANPAYASASSGSGIPGFGYGDGGSGAVGTGVGGAGAGGFLMIEY